MCHAIYKALKTPELPVLYIITNVLAEPITIPNQHPSPQERTYTKRIPHHTKRIPHKGQPAPKHSPSGQPSTAQKAPFCA